jgi:hypothetical protein
MIDKNKIDLITKFFDENLLETGQPCTNPSVISLEGFYINENILGLVSTLKKRLLPDNVKINESELMGNFFSKAMGTREVTKGNTKFNLFENETIAQTYFIRNLLREHIGDGYHLLGADINFKEKQPAASPSTPPPAAKPAASPSTPPPAAKPGQISDHLLLNGVKYQDNQDRATELYKILEYRKKPLEYWFESSYDFNKSYTEEPPIATFMKAYFEKEGDDKSNYVINNFYLFYVVSNNKIEKCANQIKLVSDSKNLIDVISEYQSKLKV